MRMRVEEVRDCVHVCVHTCEYIHACMDGLVGMQIRQVHIEQALHMFACVVSIKLSAAGGVCLKPMLWLKENTKTVSMVY